MRRKRSLSASELGKDDVVVFFPSIATKRMDGDWSVEIRGQIFEPKPGSVKRQLFLELLRRSLKISKRGEPNFFFERRTPLFLVESKSKQISVQWDDRSYRLQTSDRSGHLHDTLKIPSSVEPGWHVYRTLATRDQPHVFSGRVLMLKPKTIVVSDIDDTIKVTGVRQRRVMMTNTFLRPYKAVPGMADIYRDWAKTIKGAAFYFISATPWPLSPELERFMRQEGFPEGAMQFKRFRWRGRGVIGLFQSPAAFKAPRLDTLFERFPDASFILVGDSGERDPEIYGAVARRHPKCVRNIFIRHLQTSETAARYAKAFDGLPKATWQVFRNAQELEGVLHD